MQLHYKIVFTGTLTCLTGLHIGASRESAEIGGIDNPIIRTGITGEPFIPGSSLKGKIRSLLEQLMGLNPEGNSLNDGNAVSLLFGGGGDAKKLDQLEKEKGSLEKAAYEQQKAKIESRFSRLIVRDAYLMEDWKTKLKEAQFTDGYMTEVKFENTINRIQGTAGNPRVTERVPEGAVFEVKMVINVFAEKEETTLAEERKKQYCETLKLGMDLLNMDYLGGSGSRGYGQVKLTLAEPTVYTAEKLRETKLPEDWKTALNLS